MKMKKKHQNRNSMKHRGKWAIIEWIWGWRPNAEISYLNAELKSQTKKKNKTTKAQSMTNPRQTNRKSLLRKCGVCACVLCDELRATFEFAPRSRVFTHIPKPTTYIILANNERSIDRIDRHTA